MRERKTKKQQVIDLIEKGLSTKEIVREAAKDLGMFNSTVYKIIQDYKRDRELEKLKVK